MKKTLWVIIALVILGFCLTGMSVANAQDRNTGKQRTTTSQKGEVEKPKMKKPHQAAEPSKKNGKRIITPGKDLS
jgi:hypothetical protein